MRNHDDSPELHSAPDAEPGDGPLACLSGELADHADLALTDVIVEHVFTRGLDEKALTVLRLVYWMQWYDSTGMWLSAGERDCFALAVELARHETPCLSDSSLISARQTAALDAGDACAAARNFG